MNLVQKSSIRAIILDMDGVLWREDQAIGDLPWIFSQIQALNWQVALATNNASRSPAQHLEKLRRFGVDQERSRLSLQVKQQPIICKKDFHRVAMSTWLEKTASKKPCRLLAFRTARSMCWL